MEPRQVTGMLGAALLFLGAFAPIISAPIIGSVNYFRNGEGDGVIILVLAAVTALLVLARRYQGLWLTGFGSLASLAYTFINFTARRAEMKRDMESELAGNPFRGLADMAVESVQLQWGWAVLVIGALLVIAAAAMKPGRESQSAA